MIKTTDFSIPKIDNEVEDKIRKLLTKIRDWRGKSSTGNIYLQEFYFQNLMSELGWWADHPDNEIEKMNALCSLFIYAGVMLEPGDFRVNKFEFEQCVINAKYDLNSFKSLTSIFISLKRSLSNGYLVTASSQLYAVYLILSNKATDLGYDFSQAVGSCVEEMLKISTSTKI